MKLNIQLFAVPFRKTSKTSKRMRRTHYKIEGKTTTSCPKCGTYKGKEVLDVKETTKD